MAQLKVVLDGQPLVVKTFEEAIVVQEGQPTAEIAAEVRTPDTSAPPGSISLEIIPLPT